MLKQCVELKHAFKFEKSRSLKTGQCVNHVNISLFTCFNLEQVVSLKPNVEAYKDCLSLNKCFKLKSFF